ncbi:DHH family phosphoesterase, partial [Candidatus Woesearchaeota archaeon]|nr:DHH family phosphoesterase [Candidatus Woesearchaeota archaeon]
GGHRSAAGAIIDSAREEDFVDAFRKALDEQR